MVVRGHGQSSEDGAGPDILGRDRRRQRPAFLALLALETSVLSVVCLVPHVLNFRDFGCDSVAENVTSPLHGAGVPPGAPHTRGCEGPTEEIASGVGLPGAVRRCQRLVP